MSRALQIIHDIEEMKVRGAFLITQTAMEALALRAQELAPDGADACRYLGQGRSAPRNASRRDRAGV